MAELPTPGVKATRRIRNSFSFSFVWLPGEKKLMSMALDLA